MQFSPCYRPPLLLSKHEVCNLFRLQKIRTNTRVLHQPALFCPHIYINTFLHSAHCCSYLFNVSVIVPVSKKAVVTLQNNYRPVAVAPVVMKLVKSLVLIHLLCTTGSKLDSRQFAYQASRLVDDAVFLLHPLAP